MIKTKKKLIQISVQFKDETELQILKHRYEIFVHAKGLRDTNGRRRSFNRWCVNHLLEASKHELFTLVQDSQKEPTN